MQFYSKSSIKPPPRGGGGVFFISQKAEVGALNRDGGLFEGRVYLI